MIGLLRLAVILFVGLTVVYVCLVFYFRAGEKTRLEAQWAREQPPLPEHTFVQNGLRDYQSSLKRKLLWGVYIVPVALICLVVYFINFH